jgi:tripartite tricarboxylate transporter TctB family protein
MTLRSDHVAGAAFVAFGIAIIALSGDLPLGQLSMPGSGFMPRILAVLTIVCGGLLVLRANESAPFAETSWSDGWHALRITFVTAVAIYFYAEIGFVITMGLMIIALLVFAEREKPRNAVAYSAAVVLITYFSFEYVLKTPLPEAPLTLHGFG